MSSKDLDRGGAGKPGGGRACAAESREIDDLALDVVSECRVALMIQFRFLNAALWRMPFELASAVRALGTDGTRLRVSPVFAIRRFRTCPNELIRDYLHLVLHCVFRHPFDFEHANGEVWGLACDIAVEAVALEMSGRRFASERDEACRRVIGELEERFGSLIPKRLYREFARLLGQDDRGGLDFELLFRLFLRDGHERWACNEMTRKRKRKAGGNGAPDLGTLRKSSESRPGEQGGFFGATPGLDEGDCDERDWENVAKSIEAELAAQLGSKRGEADSLMTLLSLANRRKYDYADFLRRFCTMSEDMKVNDEEFDYIFYTYGMNRYGNMPLVEPLEYRESDRIREFVIVADTSGSTSGPLVRKFIERTYGILKDSEIFGAETNVHVIQSDDAVRLDTKITCARELDDYLANLTVRGFAGTDFRPAFAYVDRLVEQGEFENLQGLIYFTDGFGIYPKKAPSYDVAFVFVGDGVASARVPPWAMKVMMDEDEVLDL